MNPHSHTRRMAAEARPISNIAPNGDVTFIVGPEQTRLTVDSRCVRAASRVFDAMLGPDWGVGARIEANGHDEVELPEDDADALRIIFLVLHHRNDDLYDLLPSEVYDISIVADKYNLFTALRQASPVWLEPRPENVQFLDSDHGWAYDMDTCHGTVYLMAAAYLFRDEEQFVARSVDLLQYGHGSFIRMVPENDLLNFLPWHIFSLLEERRTAYRAALAGLLAYVRNKTCRACKYGIWLRQSCKALLEDQWIGPGGLEHSIASLLSFMEEVFYSTSARRPRCPKMSIEGLEIVLDNLRKYAAICSQCVVNSGSKPEDQEPCVHDHGHDVSFVEIFISGVDCESDPHSVDSRSRQ